MQRIIKFRAWDKVTNSMLRNPSIDFERNKFDTGRRTKSVCENGVCIQAPIIIYGDIEYVMQFTGLYDVNGKEIYEGDIIKHRYFSNKGIADVRWSNEQGYYLAIEPDGSRTMLNANSEIVGNIWENPELLTNN